MVQIEDYEWAQLWWEEANSKSERILLIGDSITNAYWYYVNKAFKGKFCVDKLATSKGPDNDLFLYEIDYFLKKAGNSYQTIHFNNGLHARHLSADDYGIYVDKVLAHIVASAPNSRIIAALSTPVTKNGNTAEYAEFNEEVIKRNEKLKASAEKYGVVVNDLYSAVCGKAEIRTSDGFHYNDEGYVILGTAVVNAISK